jgi:uncharacterized protein (TIGR02145 family)
VQNNGSLLNCVLAYNYANNGAAVAGSDGILTNNTITSNFTVANCGTVNDIDGNIYTTVVIGEQCWMRENLRTTRFADGTAIKFESANVDEAISGLPQRYNPNGNADNVATYGYLYNWHAVMRGSTSSNANPSGVRGVCPTGWHVPSEAEWTQLTTYLQNHTAFLCGNENTHIAKAMSATTGWASNATVCSVGNQQNLNNSSGFNVLPAGKFYRFYVVGSSVLGYADFSNKAYLWSATELNNGSAYYHTLSNNSSVFGTADTEKCSDFSVRCLQD